MKRERDKEEERELLWVKRETMRKRDKESEMNKKVNSVEFDVKTRNGMLSEL